MSREISPLEEYWLRQIIRDIYSVNADHYHSTSYVSRRIRIVTQALDAKVRVLRTSVTLVADIVLGAIEMPQAIKISEPDTEKPRYPMIFECMMLLRDIFVFTQSRLNEEIPFYIKNTLLATLAATFDPKYDADLTDDEKQLAAITRSVLNDQPYWPKTSPPHN